MPKISRRCRLSDSTGVRFLRYLHREEAESLQRAKAIEAEEMRGGAVVSFRLTPVRLNTNVRPGSFGIAREHVPVGRSYGLSGGIIFSHKANLYDGAHA